MEAARQPLPGGRWHLQHGPIDIVIGADGDPAAVHAAHEAAWARFQGVLRELVAELPRLKQPVDAGGGCPLQGPVARRMWHACAPHAAVFITPMAAVAGSVAEELVAFYRREGVMRAYVNNGGDIALHLTPGTSLRAGLFADLARFDDEAARRSAVGALPLDGRIEIRFDTPVRGLATSGWRGRSFSLGVADAVTVLAAGAAAADAAASMVANAVNAEHPAVERRPARDIKDDSDLGDLPVTVAVGPLPPALRDAALAAGLARARELRAAGLLHDAMLWCQGRAALMSGAREIPVPDLVQ